MRYLKVSKQSIDKISVQKSLDAAPPTYNPPDKIRLTPNCKYSQNFDNSYRKWMESCPYYAQSAKETMNSRTQLRLLLCKLWRAESHTELSLARQDVRLKQSRILFNAGKLYRLWIINQDLDVPENSRFSRFGTYYFH
jgi:hypothetical protein